jgi:uncharacterized DUF497 family protein
MDIEFDPAKDQANIAKHGLPLVVGEAVLRNLVGEVVDVRHQAEERMIAFGMVAGRLLVCVYTVRGNAARIISVRMASRKERQQWLGSS